MATIDIFNNDAFSMVSMTQAFENVDTKPQRIGEMGIFDPAPIRTDTAMVESRDNGLVLIQTSERGAPLAQRDNGKRKVRSFRTPRVAQQDVIQAAELQGIRAFGSETEFAQVQQEVARRVAGPAGLIPNTELTFENMRLGAVQGIVLDADGSQLYDYFSEFGITQDTEIDFDLDNASPASGAVRKKCSQVVRQMRKASKGAWTTQTRIVGLCGSAFWDDLTGHKEVRETYLNTLEAKNLRGQIAYEHFDYGGIHWEEYIGTDDGTTVAIDADKAKFFPAGSPGTFQHVMSPAEFEAFINTPGKAWYTLIVPDRDRGAWTSVETYAYPLFLCSRPKMLQRAKRT